MSTSPPSSLPTNSPISPLANTSTLLFGFLVSALSIFAVFMTFAIVWNRLVARRRAIDATLAISSPASSQPIHRPKIWDVWATPDKQLPAWLGTKPLAAQKCDDPTSSPRTRQTRLTISFWRQPILDRVPPEVAYLFHWPIPQTSSAPGNTDIPLAELPHGSDIQILLLISMPQAPHPTQRQHEDFQRLPEMVFATTNVFFHSPAAL